MDARSLFRFFALMATYKTTVKQKTLLESSALFAQHADRKRFQNDVVNLQKWVKSMWWK